MHVWLCERCDLHIEACTPKCRTCMYPTRPYYHGIHSYTSRKHESKSILHVQYRIHFSRSMCSFDVLSPSTVYRVGVFHDLNKKNKACPCNFFCGWYAPTYAVPQPANHQVSIEALVWHDAMLWLCSRLLVSWCSHVLLIHGRFSHALRFPSKRDLILVSHVHALVLSMQWTGSRMTSMH